MPLGGPQGDEQPPAPGYWWDGFQWRPPSATTPSNAPGAAPPPPLSGGPGATDPVTGLSNGPGTPAAGTPLEGAGVQAGYSNGVPVNYTGTLSDPIVNGGKDPRYYGGSAVPEDFAANRQARDKLEQMLTSYQPRTAPQATAAGPTDITQALPATVGAAAQSTIPTVGPAQYAGRPDSINGGQVNAATIAATPGAQTATIAPIERVTAPSFAGATPSAGATKVDAATVDQTASNQFRGGQSDLASQLQAAAAGKTPSAADLTGKKLADEAAAQQLGLVGLNHGRGAGGALRQAGMNIAQIQQKNAADTAINQAKEQETARGQLAGVLGQGREQDIGLATTGAQLQQQAGTTNAQLGTQVSVSNADRLAAANMKDAELKLAAAQGNQAAQNEMAKRQAELTTSTSVSNADRAASQAMKQAELTTGAATTTGQLQLEAAKSNQTTDTSVALANAAAENRMRELQAQIASQNGIANAAQQNELTQLQAQLSNTTGITNAAQANDTARADAANNLQVTLHNLDAKLKEQGLDDTQRQAYLDAWVKQNALVTQMNAAQNSLTYDKPFSWRDAVSIGEGVLQSGAKAYQLATQTPAATAASDVRVKKDIVKVDDKAAQRLADALGPPSEWTYTGKHDDGNRHVGWMAQDLEKDPLGAKFVREGEDGTKAVDYQGLTAALLAAALRSRKGRR